MSRSRRPPGRNYVEGSPPRTLGRDYMSGPAGTAQAAVLAALVVTGTVAVWHVYAIALVAGTVTSIN